MRAEILLQKVSLPPRQFGTPGIALSATIQQSPRGPSSRRIHSFWALKWTLGVHCLLACNTLPNWRAANAKCLLAWSIWMKKSQKIVVVLGGAVAPTAPPPPPNPGSAIARNWSTYLWDRIGCGEGGGGVFPYDLCPRFQPNASLFWKSPRSCRHNRLKNNTKKHHERTLYQQIESETK